MNQRRRSDAVTLEIAAPPARVYELVSDVTRMGEWSPECSECTWIDGATGPVAGARFKARNRGARGPSWSNRPVVTVAEPGREFAFNREGAAIGSYTWSYELVPTGTGTRITESFRVERPMPRLVAWMSEKLTGSTDRDADLHDGMVTTLTRLKAAAEGAAHAAEPVRGTR